MSRKAGQTKIYKCSICNAPFGSLQGVLKHRKAEHPEIKPMGRPLKKQTRKKITEFNLLNESKIMAEKILKKKEEEEKETFKCPECEHIHDFEPKYCANCGIEFS